MPRHSNIPPSVVAAAQRAGLGGRRLWIPARPQTALTDPRDAAFAYMAFRRAQRGREGLKMAAGVAGVIWPEVADDLVEMVMAIERTWIWMNDPDRQRRPTLRIVPERREGAKEVEKQGA